MYRRMTLHPPRNLDFEILVAIKIMKPWLNTFTLVAAIASLLVATNCDAQQPQRKIYLIGNSLTWDTLPGLLDGNVSWHVDCGKNLKHIYDHPSKPCVRTSTPWNQALVSDQFDVLCVQPHFGTTLQQDVEIISKWLKMQKCSRLVIHTGWNRHKDLIRVYNQPVPDESESDKAHVMTHTPGYFTRLDRKIKHLHPELEIVSTHAIEVLASINDDIESATAPIEQISEIYRDDIHVTTQAGRFLMHNLMRVAVGQEVSDQGFQVERPLRKYLRTKIDFASKLRSSRLVAANRNN
ncbi:MAG: hypothetical protein Aurels2KO_33690 [Aureliella sp.]